jgi:hypothetical protein
MAGAPSIPSVPEPRRPRSHADPPAASDCNSAQGISPRNASLATAPLHPLLSRIPPQHPKPERRRCLSWDSTRKGSSAWFRVVASRGVPDGNRGRRPRGGRLHPSAIRHPVGRSARLPLEGGLACSPPRRSTSPGGARTDLKGIGGRSEMTPRNHARNRVVQWRARDLPAEELATSSAREDGAAVVIGSVRIMIADPVEG